MITPAKIPARRKLKAYCAPLVVPEAMRASEVTIPGVELYHYITDDQLSELSTMRADPVMEVAMASAGAFAGTLVPAAEALSRFQDTANPMGYIGLLTIVIAVVSFAMAAFSGILWYRRRKRHEGLAAAIRSRPKVKVTPASDFSSGSPQAGQFTPLT